MSEIKCQSRSGFNLELNLGSESGKKNNPGVTKKKKKSLLRVFKELKPSRP